MNLEWSILPEMKPIARYIFTLSILALSANSLAQESYINYYKSIKKYDLSILWKASKLPIVDGDVESIPFPEPTGFIGSNYQRFYIHYTSIIKDTVSPYRYIVKGKTKVDNHICSFTGTITVTKAKINPVLYYGKYKQGEVVCQIELKENSSQSGSGFIKGVMISNWYLDKAGRIHYDTLDAVADGFSNNESKAVWTSYKTGQRKRSNWGDFRIPESGDLDIGAGEFSVNDKYVKNGWQNYMNQFSTNKAYAKNAISEEKRQWWK